MVLVAQMEPLSGAEPREVSRFIVDDLVQTLEVSVPFSMVRIRDYPAVITSADAGAAGRERQPRDGDHLGQLYAGGGPG